ncbi:MBL fold metallo-hydrolase [Rufibacter tibetensis]|uniref:MBL fold metallo-hydrolase n=1 Tax=Rufibacter tibetensis TaxID=512763 RepID=A0A0P0CV75_9BACT|nr:MBL fold metallo-hydrolase [Rufibacter tibetensis]ALI98317.1 MBL fold metallo-hydrolase [Rufibacter tibetensis]
MKFKFLGTGGAFDIDYGNSAALVEFKDQTILLDCGFTVYPTLRKHQLTRGITYILLTHLHNDHTGSLANILLHCYYFNTHCRPTILYPDDDFRDELYEFLRFQLQKPEQYVDFAPLSEVPGIIALDTFGLHAEKLQSYAFIFEEEDGDRVVYSGDLGQPDALFAYLRGMPPKATTIYHDITFSEENIAHTYYKKLIPLAQDYQIYGYHCDPLKNPTDNPLPLVFNQPELMLPARLQEAVN